MERVGSVTIIHPKDDSSAELDVAAATAKEAAGISLPASLSLSTVGLNPHTEKRDEAQPLDDVVDDARDGVEDTPEDVSLPSALAPSLAQSLAPSLASIKNATDAVAAAAIQYLAPTEPRSDHSVTSSKSATAKENTTKEVVEEINDEVESPAENEAETQDALQFPSLQASRSRSISSKTSKLSVKSNKSSVEQALMEDSSLRSGKTLKVSNKSDASKKSVKETVVEEKGENNQDLKTSELNTNDVKEEEEKAKPTQQAENIMEIEVSAINLNAVGEKTKQKKKLSLLLKALNCRSKTKKAWPKNRSVKNEKKLSQLKQKHPGATKSPVAASPTEPTPVAASTTESTPVDTKSPVAESTPVDVESPVIEPTPVEVEPPVIEPTPVEVESPVIESTPIDTPAESVPSPQVGIAEVTKSESAEKKVDSTDTPAEPVPSLQEVVDIAEVAKSETEVDNTQEVQVVENAPAVETAKPTADANVAKVYDFDICSPAAILDSVNCWFQQATGQEEKYGSANISVANSDEKEKMLEHPSIAEMINEIKTRWIPAPEEPQCSLNEDTAADISQAVSLLNEQRTIIKEAEEAIKREEDITQGENKARLMKKLSDAKQLEKAAKELVHHLFNSLTAKDRLEAIRLSDEIAEAEKEVAENDQIDFGRMQIDPYVRTVKAEYDGIDNESVSTIGGNAREHNSKALSKFPTKIVPRVPSA